jgi:ABC-2 type transport system permease protein
MNNILLIIKREYVSRVLKRKFILTTLLTPLAFALLFAVIGLIFTYQSDSASTLLVVDEAEVLNKENLQWKNISLVFSDENVDLLRKNLDQEVYAGILHIPREDSITDDNFRAFFYADKDLDLQDKDLIRDRLRYRVRQYRMKTLGVDESLLDRVNVGITLDPEPLVSDSADGDRAKDASPFKAEISAVIGMVMGFIIYFMVFFNGYMIMRSVMEEKINRIVEIMISTVKPFQLMVGKLVGVGAVGMTQILIWVILIPILINVISLAFNIDPNSISDSAAMGASAVDQESMETGFTSLLDDFYSINWLLVLPMLVFYYIGGYFIYASLFAAAGSAIGDDLGEAQSLTLPITIPIILALYIGIVTVQAPNSSLAVFSSIFPLFSPIVMPARLVFEPPMWQILLSVLFLILGVLLIIWVSARIYRVGILLYGKKASLKEVGKWMLSK